MSDESYSVEDWLRCPVCGASASLDRAGIAECDACGEWIEVYVRDE